MSHAEWGASGLSELREGKAGLLHILYLWWYSNRHQKGMGRSDLGIRRLCEK